MMDQNGYQMHGIEHNSVSALNKFEENVSAWVASYLFKKRFPASGAMWRGIVAEDITMSVLTEKMTFEAALKNGIEKFDRMTGLIKNDWVMKERGAIKDYAELSIEALKEYGKPSFNLDGSQQKVSIRAAGDGWKLDFIGYLDFVYPQHGLVIDLKTTGRMPSKMSPGHIRQRCFYQRCMGNSQVKFLYVTPKKFGFLEDGDTDTEMAKIKTIMNRQEKFLRLGDKEFIRSIVPHNPHSFYWGGGEDIARELFY
tara:strand:- start:863 stop:1624 length:762 start_codon:yes stop_codon:yes gene_type:complete